MVLRAERMTSFPRRAGGEGFTCICTCPAEVRRGLRLQCGQVWLAELSSEAKVGRALRARARRLDQMVGLCGLSGTPSKEALCALCADGRSQVGAINSLQFRKY